VRTHAIILALCMAPLLPRCDMSAAGRQLLRSPVKAENANWRMEIKRLKAGPNSYTVMTNRATWGGKNETFAVVNGPQSSGKGYVWLLVTVGNIGKAKRTFDFSRVRLIGEKYVSRPVHIYSDALLYGEGYEHAIRPGGEMTRWLAFEYDVGRYPYRMAYDVISGGAVADVIKAPLPVAGAGENGRGVCALSHNL
jgi:hypothetical protein